MESLRMAVDFGLLVLIWLVQLIIYPSFAAVVRDEFVAWHYRYTGWITCVVAPLMFGQAAIIGLQLFLEPNLPTWISAAVVGMCWVVTFAVSVPLHGALQKQGNEPDLVQRLVWTNWPRTVGWTVVGLIAAWQWWTITGWDGLLTPSP